MINNVAFAAARETALPEEVALGFRTAFDSGRGLGMAIGSHFGMRARAANSVRVPLSANRQAEKHRGKQNGEQAFHAENVIPGGAGKASEIASHIHCSSANFLNVRKGAKATPNR